MNTLVATENFLSLCAGKDCEGLTIDEIVCSSCVDALDGLLDEVSRIYPFLTLLVNNTFANGNNGGVIDGSVNLSALEAVDNIDRIIDRLFKHVAEKTSFIDFPRDADGMIIDGFDLVTNFETPLPMGGTGYPTLRRVVWLRADNESFTNLEHVAQMTDAGKIIEKLKRAVAVADEMTVSKAGRVLLGSCMHCNDERDLWLEKGAQGAVCRSCWKTNSLADNFRAVVKAPTTERLMTAPSIAKAFGALDILLTASTIASWDAAERRRVAKGASKGQVIESRLEVKQVIEVKSFDGKTTRERRMYSFEDVYAYWHRVNEAKMKAQRAKIAADFPADFLFEVTV